MKCPLCGENNINEFKFCYKCGHALEEKKKVNKLLIILPIIILILTISLVIFLMVRNKKEDKFDLSEFSINNPIKVKKDDLYGYINSNGEFIIEANFKEATNFHGKFAIVKTSDEKNPYAVIDREGNKRAKAQNSYDINYYEDENIWVINNMLYNGVLRKISKDKETVKYEKYGYLSYTDKINYSAGIMDYTGNKIYSYKFKNDENFLSIKIPNVNEKLSDKYCIINIQNEKYGIVNCKTGKTVYEITDKYINSYGNNIFLISDLETHALIYTIYIENDEIIFESSDIIEVNFLENGYLEIRKGVSYSYFDIKNKKMVLNKPSMTQSITINEYEKLFNIKTHNCGNAYTIKRDEKEILSCEWTSFNFLEPNLYEYLASLGREYVLAVKGSKTYLVNLKDGKTKDEFNVKAVNDTSSSFIYYKEMDSNDRTIYNLITNKSMKTSIDNELRIYSNYITIKENEKLNYYNINFELIYTET